ncbi:hypothetical protein ABS198_22805, partial [Acinetobacter baumannii]
DYKQTLTPTSPEVELVGRATYPARFRGRLFAQWSQGPWAVGGAVNHVGRFRDTEGRRVDAWTTVDLNLQATTPPGS